jgi:hypothetical protein
MDLSPLRPWLTLVHVLGVLAFVLLHGASAAVAFKLRGERDRVRIQALLELSNAYLNWMYLALLGLLLGGILSGIAAGFWTSGDLWIWASLALFISMLVAMYVIATPYFDELRHAVGLATFNDVRKKLEPPPPASDEELARLLASPRPAQTAVVGLGGIAVIAWLMMMKPF